MNFYKVTPINEFSGSRRWFVDEIGLQVVKDKYTNYNKDPLHVIDRWDEFKVIPIKEILFDFGGMLRIGTPIVKETIGDTNFELMVTHIPFLLEALNSESFNYQTYWKCGTRFFSYIFSSDVKDQLKNTFSAKGKIYEEMIEGFNRDMDNAIAKSNGRVVSIKPYHEDKNV